MRPEDEQRLFRWLERVQDGRPWESLSGFEATILLVYTFELEICNGGIEQFFVNPSGDKWPDTLAALKRIGAARITTIFEQALKLFPNGRPSTDHLTRARQLSDAQPTAGKVLWNLTDEYQGLYREDPEEDSYAVMIRFLDNGGQTIGTGKN